MGEWSNQDGLNITNPEAFHEFGKTNITLKVTTIEVSYENIITIFQMDAGTDMTGLQDMMAYSL